MSKEKMWDKAYQAKQNFLFYPNEELIRFVSQHFRKRIGINDYLDVRNFETGLRSLDLGCGIGRHLIYLSEVGFDSFGVDLSAEAVDFSRNWLERKSTSDPLTHVKQGSATALPWSDGYFDCVVSHAVLDSMTLKNARAVALEIARVLSPRGLAYVDLIGGIDSDFDGEFDGEIEVEKSHEKGTIQSYFTQKKIEKLWRGTGLTVRDCRLLQYSQLSSSTHGSRYHLTLERVNSEENCGRRN